MRSPQGMTRTVAATCVLVWTTTLPAASTVTEKCTRGRAAGPRITAPFRSNWLPWQGQLICRAPVAPAGAAVQPCLMGADQGYGVEPRGVAAHGRGRAGGRVERADGDPAGVAGRQVAWPQDRTGIHARVARRNAGISPGAARAVPAAGACSALPRDAAHPIAASPGAAAAGRPAGPRRAAVAGRAAAAGRCRRCRLLRPGPVDRCLRRCPHRH